MSTSRGAKPTEPKVTKPIESVLDALRAAEPRPDEAGIQSEKKNYAERFSRALAIFFANKLRPSFPGVTPDAQGRRQESRVPTAKGYKRLDVNYSTPQLGLGLGLSVKTLNFPDPKSGRYTKNYTRIDNELRAEASDYHVRQPYSVLIGVIFLPMASCLDGRKGPSSFSASLRIFRARNRRRVATDAAELFERIFIALYDPITGQTCFFDVGSDPPDSGPPPADQCLSVEELLEEVAKTFEERNPSG